MKLAERLYNAAYEHTNGCPTPSHSRFELLDEQNREKWEAAAQAAEDAFLAGLVPVPLDNPTNVDQAALYKRFDWRSTPGMTEETYAHGLRLSLLFGATARALINAGIAGDGEEAQKTLQLSWLWTADNLRRRGE